jgi:hypothetical protein
MSPEWMIVIDRMHATAHRPSASGLCDPLEREEWRGLGWFNGLVCRLLTTQGHERPTASSWASARYSPGARTALPRL